MSDTDQFSDQEILARTVYGEDRGGDAVGMAAVANVIINRVNSGITWWGSDIRSVCLHPSQFSCWNTNDPNRPKIIAVTTDDPVYLIAMSIAKQAIAGSLLDLTNGATMYYAPPGWSEGLTPCANIAKQLFFKV